ncbi:LamG-like jellyroll fold domain-containing protein [Luteolibacter luteus]|uniref:Alkaline phosphatase n=1 Tax=Luteolibacter luteus TaxID=2728835 RepID=A0A858RDU5_9BACT|nr:LamG-like jellyroll fold domain-containing protein [Luteolibacter luteus]QJE95256.1 alkaline phosphatase [Luteolibacter luteus]
MRPLSTTRAILCATALLGTTSLCAQTGPMIGTVKTTEAWLLYRPGAVEKSLRLSVLDTGGQVVATSDSTSAAANDFVAKFHVTGLSAATAYRYKIEDTSGSSPMPLAGPEDGLRFKTRLTTGTQGTVTAAFVSCANNTSEPVWERIGTLKPDQVILGGDTPYVDVADLATSRTKHRAFLETPFMSSLIRGTSAVGTWDDHDFGLNNGNGVTAADRRENTRKAFVEYRAHEQFGTGSEAVYHKVDLGVMEIFLLDPRWFSQTGPSPADPAKKTTFGEAQWQWIKEALEASRAPFKVLTMGEVWEDKKNSENDDMFTYWHERDALFDFIRSKAIPGVVLLGGDIHVSRHLVHPQRIGYDLHDFVTSPAHTSVIASLDVPHPSLEWSSQQPRQFLTLTADTRVNPPLLTARYYLADGTVQREVAIPYDQLVPKEGEGLGRGLRAWWSFDGDLKNKSVLGSRIDADAVNGASLIAEGGLRGGAASLSRAAGQYLHVGRSALDDNTAAYTASMWCKPASLPSHGSAERHFLIESTLAGTVGNEAGYSISAGLRAGNAPDKVNLELFTHTLQPAGPAPTAAPTPLAQGGFSCMLDRSLFEGKWAHVALTFDSTFLRLYVNGSEVAAHELPIPGPVSETGGFVIGGHREGAGRNFDGLLDEIALWSRALSPSEITTLYHGGTPQTLPTEVSATDTDGDTLEDWWEVLCGLDPENADDALADSDHDSVPAWLERASGTHPLVDNSSLYDYLRQLVDPGVLSAPLLFRHPSQDTLRFRLHGKASRDLVEWSPFTSGAGVSGDVFTGEFLFSLPLEANGGQFFRFDINP